MAKPTSNTMHRIVLLLVLSEHLGKGFLQELNEEVGYGQIDHVWSSKPTENDGHSDTHTQTLSHTNMYTVDMIHMQILLYAIYIYTHTLSHIDRYGVTVYKYICLSLNLNGFSQAK